MVEERQEPDACCEAQYHQPQDTGGAAGSMGHHLRAGAAVEVALPQEGLVRDAISRAAFRPTLASETSQFSIQNSRPGSASKTAADELFDGQSIAFGFASRRILSLRCVVSRCADP